MKIAILGAHGLVGNAVTDELMHSNTTSLYLIVRHNYEQYIGEKFDVLINANGNSNRWWANQHPIRDFHASTVSVANTMEDFISDLYIHISTVDVYSPNRNVKTETTVLSPLDLSPYGFHKYLAELIVKQYSTAYIILRCSAVVGPNLKKGAIYDMIYNKKTFLTKSSKLQFITAEEIAKVVKLFIFDYNSINAIYNVGGLGTVSMKDAANLMGIPVEFLSEIHQDYEMDVRKLDEVYTLQTSKQYIKDFWSCYHARVE